MPIRGISRRWKEAIGASGFLGVAVIGGLMGSFSAAAAYTARYAEATSYLSDNPATCTNCHIMNEQYDSWSSSPHHSRATCNDCHVPHDSIISKYYVKGEHGYRHSKRFTLQDFHEPIQITEHSRNVVIDNCVRCHQEMTHEIREAAVEGSPDESKPAGGVDCVRCHTRVAHGSRR